MSKQEAHNSNLVLVRAYRVWQSCHYAFVDIDQKVEPFLSIAANGANLKEAREAQFLTVERAASSMGVSRAAYIGYEKRAQVGNITLKSLDAAARAIGCDLVYGIRPKSKMIFSAQIWSQVLPLVLKDKSIWHLRWYFKANAMAAIAHKLINDAEFRRDQGWSERGINEWWSIRQDNHIRFIRLSRPWT